MCRSVVIPRGRSLRDFRQGEGRLQPLLLCCFGRAHSNPKLDILSPGLNNLSELGVPVSNLDILTLKIQRGRPVGGQDTYNPPNWLPGRKTPVRNRYDEVGNSDSPSICHYITKNSHMLTLHFGCKSKVSVRAIRHSDIPIPKLHGYYLSNDNTLGTPFLIIEYINASPLTIKDFRDKRWRLHIMRQLVRLYVYSIPRAEI